MTIYLIFGFIKHHNCLLSSCNDDHLYTDTFTSVALIRPTDRPFPIGLRDLLPISKSRWPRILRFWQPHFAPTVTDRVSGTVVGFDEEIGVCEYVRAKCKAESGRISNVQVVIVQWAVAIVSDISANILWKWDGRTDGLVRGWRLCHIHLSFFNRCARVMRAP